MKLKRQAKILELINNYDIETQEELADRLREAGFEVTQATVSRDIRELKLTKVANEKGIQKYSVIGQSERIFPLNISGYLKKALSVWTLRKAFWW